ncbi:MAG TPA: type IV toxin-antitoxin system AbiEi family antitoxin domain-containing protein [bacterium]|nr:type IV toxin-antitoxin system AbiEi family antitoxin domain-containing protein [bacterium]
MKNKEKILKLVKKKGMITAGDLEKTGVYRNLLYEMCDEGLLVRQSRGLYSASDTQFSEHLSLIEIAKRSPDSVICLISALSFHGVTTQLPHEVWIVVKRGSWIPKYDSVPVNVTVISGNAFDFGIEKHKISGIEIKVYSIAKTVADCFKFRNKIGLDVAIEALKEVVRSRKATVNEIMKAAEICRVGTVIRPYLEAVI